ncbi:Cys-Gly metallodipeptidase dug1 [Yarrowia sp. B02]|nr:Cys-Gly metallodipeptidase dug1 [Yarrowia sp. B02]
MLRAFGVRRVLAQPLLSIPSRGFSTTLAVLGSRGTTRGKKKPRDKNSHMGYVQSGGPEAGDIFLFSSEQEVKAAAKAYSPEEDMKTAVKELRQQKKEGPLKKKNMAMRRLKLFKEPPNDNGEMFKDRYGQMTPEEKETMPTYLSFPEDHPRACEVRNPEEVEHMHLIADRSADVFVGLLRDLVVEPTVAKSYVYDGQTCSNTVQQIKAELTAMDYFVRIPEFKHPALPEDKRHPRFVFAQPKRMDHSKPTVLVYAHYDTVGTTEAGWAHDPHKMGRFQGNLTGRGVANKSVITAWICALATLKEAKIAPSVNVKFCFDPFGELGNGALEECLSTESSGFFKDISAVIVSQGQWMTDTQPSIIYGQRGVHNYYLNVKGGEKRLDAGQYGGLVREPMIELMHLVSNLTSLDQNELFPRTSNLPLHIANTDEEEARRFRDLNVTTDQLKEMLGVKQLKDTDKVAALRRIWSEPSVSINSVKHGFEPEEDYPTTIPKHATARFSLRTVPNTDMTSIDLLVRKYFESLHRSMDTSTELSVRCMSRFAWWLSSRDHWSYHTAAKAIKSVWKVTPDFVREGGTSAAPSLFEKHLKTANILCLPIGRPSDQLRTVDENFGEEHFINAVKTFCSYMYYAGDMAKVSDEFIVPEKDRKPQEKKQPKSKLKGLIPIPAKSQPDTASDTEPRVREPQRNSAEFRKNLTTRNRKRAVHKVTFEAADRSNDLYIV